MNKKLLLVLASIIPFFLTSCTFQPYYVGKEFYDPSRSCKISNAGQCNLYSNNFDFLMTMAKGPASGDCTVKGDAVWKGAGIYKKQASGSFTLYLLDGPKVIEGIPFMLRGQLTDKNNINISFHTDKKFDRLMLDYSIIVTDESL